MGKKIIVFLWFLMMILGGTGKVYGSENIQLEQEAAGQDGRSQKVFIDSQNVYTGMEKAYQDGYEPTVEENMVSVILPLQTNDEMIQSVTAVLDLGEQNQSPFIFRNYQKSFGKTVEKVNGTEEKKEVFLLRFDLELSENRKNGAYPVAVKTSCVTDEKEEIQQEFLIYVRITDEKVTPTPTSVPTPTAEPEPAISPTPSPVITEEPVSSLTPVIPELDGVGDAVSVGGAGMQEEKPSSDPKIIITRCEGVPEHIYAGETVKFTVILKNTNKKKLVQNMTVSVTCEAEGISLRADANTFYFERLGTEETIELPLELQIDEKTLAGKYTVAFTMSYDNPEATALTSNGQIDLRVEQRNEAEMEVGQIPEEINAGDGMQIPIQIMNLGRGMIYNVRCFIEVPGLRADKSLFLGNIEGGTAASGELDVFAGIVNEDAENTQERYGRTAGRIVLIYENESGTEMAEFQEIEIDVQPLEIRKEPEHLDEKPQVGKQLIAGIAALVGISGVGIGLSIWSKKRKCGDLYE